MRFFLITIFVFFPISSIGETLAERFRKGVEAFEAGQYDEAVGIFSELHERFRLGTAEVYNNLGAAEFMRGNSGKALLYFLKAMRSAPGTKAYEVAKLNAERVRAVLNEKSKGSSGFVFGPYHDAWTAVFRAVSPRGALITFLVFWSVLFLSLTASRLLRGRKPLLLITVLAFVGTLVSGFSAYGAARVAAYEIGVVVADSTPLYERPESLEPKMYLPQALEFRVLERRGTFVGVRLSSGEKGFVPERSVGIVQ